jgi:hypothetical protein
MKTLRKLIIKFFAGYYQIGKGTIPRASAIIFPSLMIPIILEIIFAPTPVLWHFIPFFIFVLISFGYLQFYPAKPEELDAAQKKQYDDLTKNK